MAVNLPQELIYDILLLLPVKSLLRFQCISRSFYTVIKSKDFINSHLRTSYEKRNHRKFIHNISNRGRIHKLDINDGSVEVLLLDFQMPFISTLVSAHCNGLLLLSTFEYSQYEYFPLNFFVWNPSTRHSKELPAFPNNKSLSNCHLTKKVSFGYDSTVDDYKAVVIITDNENRTIDEIWVVALRSSSSSCWRRIQHVPEYSKIVSNSYYQNCFVDGCLHFLLCDGNGYDFLSHSIEAFDIAKETFSTVLLPNYETVGDPSYLDAFEGCLSIGLRTERNFDFYVRKKELGDDQFSWTKLFSFAIHQIHMLNYIGILGYSKDERDKIQLSCCNHVMYSYDLKERSLQQIEMINIGNWCSVLCTESLVSVD